MLGAKRALGHAAAAYAFLVPWVGIGAVSVRGWLPLELSDVAAVVAAPLALVEAWRRRRAAAGSAILVGVLTLALAGMVADWLAGGLGWVALGTHAVPALAVLAVAMAAANDADAVRRAALAGGAGALCVGLAGFGLSLCGVELGPGAFAFRSAHPVFGPWPRLTGTMGFHAHALGEYAVAILALGLAEPAGRFRRPARATAGLAAMTLLLTLSSAWVGGGVLALGAWVRRQPAERRRGAVALASAAGLAAVAATAWVMIVGAPDGRATPGPCERFDRHHHVVLAHDDGCAPVVLDDPYPHRLTLYGLARDTSAAAFRSRPLTGVGHASYERFAEAYNAARFDHPVRSFWYRSTRGTPTGIAARMGTLGLIAFACLVFGVLRTGRTGATPWVFLGALALLAVSVGADVYRGRAFWLLLGLLAGPTLEARDGGSRGG